MSTKVIATVVNETVAAEVEEHIKKGRFLNQSDFLRSAVRRELERLKEEAA